MLIRNIVFVVTLTLCLLNTAWANDERIEYEILSVEKARVDAMLTHNLQILDQVMADECIHITTDGTLRTKAQYMQNLKSSVGRFSHFNTRDIVIRIYENMVVVTGHYDNAKIFNTTIEPTKHGVFTRIYQHRDSRWQLISHHATTDSKFIKMMRPIESNSSGG